MDTAKLTAAVATLKEYCEEVRQGMVAKGYPKAEVAVMVDPVGSIHDVILRVPGEGIHKFFSLQDADPFGKALAHVATMPQRPTADHIAATLGIAPDGKLLPEDEPVMCDVCGERPATETWGDDAPLPVTELHVCEPCADKARDRAVERAMEGC